ncbi:MAG: DinB family protein [Planctomycetota bacterium]
MRTLPEAAAEIEAIVEEWRERLLQIDADAVHEKPDPSRFSISEVVGHLIDSACNNHQRFIRAQAVEELVFPKYDQNAWVLAAGYRQASWESLVHLWYHYNRLIAVVVRNVPQDQLSTPCTITPYETCTLGFFIDDYVVHLHHHCNKLAERISRL